MNNFQRVLIVSGFIFTLGTSILDALFYDVSDWLAAALIGIIVGIVSGLCFGCIAHFLFRKENLFRKNLLWLLHLWKVLTYISVGFILGIGILIALEIIPHGQWRQIASPPEKPVRFLGQSAFTFWGGSTYVETDKGNIFSYTCDSANPCSWAKEKAPPGEPEKNLWSCPSGHQGWSITPIILFKKVVDSYEIDICGVDYTNTIHLVLLEDGTIWVWNKFSSVPDIMDLDFFQIWLTMNLATGFASYIALLIRKQRT